MLRAFLVIQVVNNLLTMLETQFGVPGSGRFPGEGNGNPLQYSCLGNPMDRGAWQATVHGVVESDATEPLTYTHIFGYIQ